MTDRLLLLKSPWQIRTVTHPLRLEIIERLQMDGPDSIAGLASKLDRRANALTYHVRLLEKAGALIRSGTRSAGRRQEAIYAVAAPRIAIGAHARSPSALRAAASSASAVCRMADREIRHALSAGLVNPGMPVGRRLKTWLTEREAAVVQRKLADLERFFRATHRRNRGRPYSLTAFLVPLRDEGKH